MHPKTPDSEAGVVEAIGVALRPPRPGEHVHMLGIGGVGMAGLALLLKSNGWPVTGCDAYPGSLLPWLQLQGIPTTVGHDAVHLRERPALIVRSPAVSWTEPELVSALKLGIPVIDRGRLLPELLKSRRTIAVAGTHGKTTTSSMVAWCLSAASWPTSYCIGGVCPGLGAVARVDHDGWMVVEADESDGTLRYYAPEIAVITSVDLDHVDYFSDHRRLLDVFDTFAGQAPRRVVPFDTELKVESFDGETTTFGLEPDAMVHAENVVLEADGSSFQLWINGKDSGEVRLSVPGQHNVLNALAAIAAGMYAGLKAAGMASALGGFQLPKRRFELVAEGRGMRVISDYAHHPVEIAALLEQARLSNPKRMIAVFQPHRYSRTKAFREEFVDVLGTLDHVIIAPVYAASEPFVEGGTSEELLASGQRRGWTHLQLADSLPDAWERLQKLWQKDDVVLIIGAGDVDQIGVWAARVLNG